MVLLSAWCNDLLQYPKAALAWRPPPVSTSSMTFPELSLWCLSVKAVEDQRPQALEDRDTGDCGRLAPFAYIRQALPLSRLVLIILKSILFSPHNLAPGTLFNKSQAELFRVFPQLLLFPFGHPALDQYVVRVLEIKISLGLYP